MWADAVDVPDDEWEDAAEYLMPCGRDFPGLAASQINKETQPLDGAFTRLGHRLWHIAMVGVSRPADAIVAMGWDGAANGDLEAAVISSVLRSWEDRFAASLVAIDGQELNLAVGHPPRSLEQAVPVAAEHYALAPDLIEQGAGSIGEYATALVGAPLWNPWWD
jgi:hypothetical protein